jgi:hypothetical protein
MFRQSSQTTTKELLAMAAKASEGEVRMAPRKKKKGRSGQLLVTWDDLIASVEIDQGQGA